MDYIFLADIGGTNARFELLSLSHKNQEMNICKKSSL